MIVNPLELVWRGVNRVRRALYRRRILRPSTLPRPVLSVGNLSAGGAGKTPAVITLARDLTRRGLRVAVLTRGYGRASQEGGVVDRLDPARFGDEPVLIKTLLPEVAIIVGRYRYRNALRFLDTHQCDVFILDDGFQHLQLARQVDLLIDAPGSRCHREGRSALKDADFVIPRSLRILNGEQLRGRRVFAFSGLADNEQFFQSVRQCGAVLAGSRGFPDHHRYTARELEGLRRAASDLSAELLVTTQKDAVKIGEHDIITLVAEMSIDPAVLDAVAIRLAAALTS